MELELDLTKGARRQDICDQLKAALGDAAWEDVQAAAAAAGVPEGHHHGIVEVRETIGALRVPDDVKRNLGGVYEILAQAEATVHECAVDDTHFHEVGNGAAILNALVICLAFHRLAPDRVIASPVQAGSGTVECAHGVMDVPAPATAAILAQGIPVCEQRLEGELCTPTSAAIIKHFVDEFA